MAVLTTCARPGCDTAVPRGYCDPCRAELAVPDDDRPSARERGYDARWERRRGAFLAANPWCVICGEPSQVPDHYPYSRRELIEAGAPDPDLPVYLRALCVRCHNRHSARTRR